MHEAPAKSVLVPASPADTDMAVLLQSIVQAALAPVAAKLELLSNEFQAIRENPHGEEDFYEDLGDDDPLRAPDSSPPAVAAEMLGRMKGKGLQKGKSANDTEGNLHY